MEILEVIELPCFGTNGKGKVTLVDGDYDGEYFGQYKWYVSPQGYAMRSNPPDETNDKFYYTYLHREVLGRQPKGMIADHINRNRLDNRSSNLRWATPLESAKNRGGKFDKTRLT